MLFPSCTPSRARGFAVTGTLATLAAAATTSAALAQGGDDAATAAPILLNTLENGTTIGFSDDADVACPVSSISPDVFYRYAPTVNHLLTVDLCESGYDTKTFVYDSNLDIIFDVFGGEACNEDSCTSSGGAPFRSVLHCVPVLAGREYFIVVDGWHGDAGPYSIGLSETGAYFGNPDICGVFDNGACCLGPPGCVVVDEPFCTALEGVFLGDGAACAEQLVTSPCLVGDAAVLCVAPALVCPGPGAECAPGPLIDAWVTPETTMGGGTSFHDFGAAGQAVPGGFFGPGSDPFEGQVALAGVPLGPVDLGKAGIVDFGPADTLILRSADPFERCDLPSPVPVAVSVELVALSLRSVEPVVVTFDGGQAPESWDVAVALSVAVPAPGTLEATKAACNRGTFTVSGLLLQPRFTFTRVDDPQVSLVFDTGLEGLDAVALDLQGGDWVSDVEDALLVPTPFCSDFRPGIQDPDPSAECDCNMNGVRDQCDIDNGISFDCNDDGLLDECGVPFVCPIDLDGSCAIDFPDLLTLLASWSPDPASCPGCLADLDGDDDVDFQDLISMLAAWGPCSEP